jgi:hypothetical protein
LAAHTQILKQQKQLNEGFTTYYQYEYLMSMDSTSPVKDIIWQTGSKRKSQRSVVYKRPTLLTEINTELGRKTGRRFTKLMAPQNRQE